MPSFSNKAVWLPDPAQGYVRGRVTREDDKHLYVKLDSIPRTPCLLSSGQEIGATVAISPRYAFLEEDLHLNPLANLFHFLRYLENRHESRSLFPLPHRTYVSTFPSKAKNIPNIIQCARDGLFMVTGDSGSGKTAITSKLLSHWVSNHPEASSIGPKVRAIQLVIGSLLHACTKRNSDSTRASYVIAIHAHQPLLSVSMSSLEYRRVSTVPKGETGFHIFCILRNGENLG